jgi:hypothetical protein
MWLFVDDLVIPVGFFLFLPVVVHWSFNVTSIGHVGINFYTLLYTTREPAFVVCPSICREQRTVKVGFAMCLTHAHDKHKAHGISGFCRVWHTGNTRHTANSNFCCKQHTAKTGHMTKANPR